MLNSGRIVGLTRTRSMRCYMCGEERGVRWFTGSSFLQSGEEESQCGWCVVSSFASVSLSFSVGVLVCRLSSAFFWSALLSRNLSFLSFFSSDRIRLGFPCFLFFLPRRSRIGRKITFIFILKQISSTFRYALILCAETPFFHFEESFSIDNIQWILSWTLAGIIILCER